MQNAYARPVANRFGDAELKRSYVKKAGLWLLMVAVTIAVPILLSSVVPLEMRDPVMCILLGAPISWFLGLGYYAKSKGYSGVLGLLGFFNLLGILILLILPDQWKQALEQEAMLAHQPPFIPHPAATPGAAAPGQAPPAYPSWWNG